MIRIGTLRFLSSEFQTDHFPIDWSLDSAPFSCKVAPSVPLPSCQLERSCSPGHGVSIFQDNSMVPFKPSTVQFRGSWMAKVWSGFKSQAIHFHPMPKYHSSAANWELSGAFTLSRLSSSWVVRFFSVSKPREGQWRLRVRSFWAVWNIMGYDMNGLWVDINNQWVEQL